MSKLEGLGKDRLYSDETQQCSWWAPIRSVSRIKWSGSMNFLQDEELLIVKRKTKSLQLPCGSFDRFSVLATNKVGRLLKEFSGCSSGRAGRMLTFLLFSKACCWLILATWFLATALSASAWAFLVVWEKFVDIQLFVDSLEDFLFVAGAIGENEFELFWFCLTVEATTICIGSRKSPLVWMKIFFTLSLFVVSFFVFLLGRGFSLFEFRFLLVFSVFIIVFMLGSELTLFEDKKAKKSSDSELFFVLTERKKSFVEKFVFAKFRFTFVDYRNVRHWILFWLMSFADGFQFLKNCVEIRKVRFELRFVFHWSSLIFEHWCWKLVEARRKLFKKISDRRVRCVLDDQENQWESV